MFHFQISTIDLNINLKRRNINARSANPAFHLNLLLILTTNWSTRKTNLWNVTCARRVFRKLFTRIAIWSKYLLKSNLPYCYLWIFEWANEFMKTDFSGKIMDLAKKTLIIHQEFWFPWRKEESSFYWRTKNRCAGLVTAKFFQAILPEKPT